MKVVTRDWIVKHTSSSHATGINGSQCIILGFEFKDLRRGWIDRCEGMVISNASAELFELLQGAKGAGKQKEIIKQFKSDRCFKNLHTMDR